MCHGQMLIHGTELTMTLSTAICSPQRSAPWQVGEKRFTQIRRLETKYKTHFEDSNHMTWTMMATQSFQVTLHLLIPHLRAKSGSKKCSNPEQIGRTNKGSEPAVLPRLSFRTFPCATPQQKRWVGWGVGWGLNTTQNANHHPKHCPVNLTPLWERLEGGHRHKSLQWLLSYESHNILRETERWT